MKPPHFHQVLSSPFRPHFTHTKKQKQNDCVFFFCWEIYSEIKQKERINTQAFISGSEQRAWSNKKEREMEKAAARWKKKLTATWNKKKLKQEREKQPTQLTRYRNRWILCYQSYHCRDGIIILYEILLLLLYYTNIIREITDESARGSGRQVIWKLLQ